MLIIGDSHGTFLVQEYIHGYLIENKIAIVSYHGQAMYSFEYERDDEKLKEIYEMIDETWVVLPFFGEVDIRVHLYKNNNPEYLAKMYVDKTLNFFKNKKCEIRFIEPPPQSDLPTDDIVFPKVPYFEDSNWPRVGPIENRIALHFKFVEALRLECSINNLKPPIQIANNITKTERLLAEESFDGAHLSRKMGQILLNYIRSEYDL